jgi:transposase
MQALKTKIKNNKDEVECVFIFWKWYYSPDLNPIEKKWTQVKSYYRKLTYYFEDKVQLIETVLMERWVLM